MKRKHILPENEIKMNRILENQQKNAYEEIGQYLDANAELEIKKKIKDLEKQVEEIGKICDNKYKVSKELFQEKIDYQKKELDDSIQKNVARLRKILIDGKIKLNFDYKGKYTDITNELNKKVDELKKINADISKLKKKKHLLEEDENFYEKQYDNINDMNIYLKYKLKMLVTGNLDDTINAQVSCPSEPNKSEKNIPCLTPNLESNLLFEKIKNIESTLSKKPKSENHLSIIPPTVANQTTDDTYDKKKELSINSKESEISVGKKKTNDFLITTTNERYTPTRYQKEQKEQIVNEILRRLKIQENYIQKKYDEIKRKNKKLHTEFKESYLRNNNIYINYLKNTCEENKKYNNSGTVDYTYSKSGSYLPSLNGSKSIQQSVGSYNYSISVDEPPKKVGEGYMTKLENKNFIVKFLEKEDVKKLIYKLIYDDNNN